MPGFAVAAVPSIEVQTLCLIPRQIERYCPTASERRCNYTKKLMVAEEGVEPLAAHMDLQVTDSKMPRMPSLPRFPWRLGPFRPTVLTLGDQFLRLTRLR